MTNYYTYIEEQKDDEVPGASILKLHKLPELPQEILDMILYKFGGLQHPIAKDMRMIKKEIKEGNVRDAWKPVSEGNTFYKHFFGYDKKEPKLVKVRHSNKIIAYHLPFHLNPKLGFLWFTLNGWRNKHRREEWMRKLESKENKLVYMCNSSTEWTKYHIKNYLYENQIEYKKSWKKSKLIQTAFSF